MKDEHGDFKILGWTPHDAQGRVDLHYGYESGLRFCESLDFHAPLPEAGGRRQSFDAAVSALCALAGVSYYKAFVPKRIVVEAPPLDASQLAFFRDLYLNGLGEFAVRNDLDLSDRAQFAYPAQPPLPGAGAPAHEALTRRSAVLIGGGKDSLVSVEALRAAHEPMVLFAVNPKQPILDCAAASGLPFLKVTRTLDPKLFALNEAGAYNGHVPITAIVSFIAIAAAFVHGFDAVVLSNERSADEATLEKDGIAVNHQFSKTSTAEAEIARYVRAHVSATLDYFSLLRPLSELHIAQVFGKASRYDAAFTSCNRAFRLRAEAPSERWCCDCPKCRFVFLMLATALPFERMIAIFGENLLDDESQLSGYEELTGLSGHKPWECVGEIGESCAAVLKLAARPEWKESRILRALAPRLKPFAPRLDEEWRRLLTPARDHSLPPRYERILHAYLGAS
jgi:UDP-N-acetyl-alpha-D-muramoyl-L-alanyl-L-glutamate epimerase